jgi:hypothetical protein
MKLSPEPHDYDDESYYERQVQRTVGALGGSGTMSSMHEEPGVNVTQVFVPPYSMPKKWYGAELYDRGTFVIYAQEKLLTPLRANPLLEVNGVQPRRDWHPYTYCPLITVPGRLLGQGMPEGMHSAQEGLDFIIGRLRETQRMMGQPKWFIPNGSISNEKELDNEVSSKVKFNPLHGPPLAWTPPAMPAYIMQLAGVLETHLNRASATPPVMQGKADGQIRSGAAVQSLQEEALTDFTPILIYLDLATANHKRQLLLREIQFGEVERTVKWPSETGWEQQMFFARELDPAFMVRILPGTSMPFSSQAQMAELERAIAWGIYQPAMNPAHAELIARVMKWKVPPTTPGNEEENLRLARFENAQLIAGEQPYTGAYYRHDVHKNEHIRFMLSERFRQMAEKDSSLIPRFMAHLGIHDGFIQLAMSGVMIPQPMMPMRDLQMQMPSGGDAGGGGVEDAAGPNSMGGSSRPGGRPGGSSGGSGGEGGSQQRGGSKLALQGVQELPAMKQMGG